MSNNQHVLIINRKALVSDREFTTPMRLSRLKSSMKGNEDNKLMYILKGFWERSWDLGLVGSMPSREGR